VLSGKSKLSRDHFIDSEILKRTTNKAGAKIRNLETVSKNFFVIGDLFFLTYFFIDACSTGQLPRILNQVRWAQIQLIQESKTASCGQALLLK
jgi:hypothetical protein